MKHFYALAAILAVAFSVLFIFPPARSVKPVVNNQKPAFYVWQRLWTPEVVKSVAEANRELFILATEFSLVKNKVKVENALVPSDVWNRKNVTPVFRLHDGLLKREIKNILLAEIAKIPVESVQFDIDCPESQLERYCDFLSEMKKSLPGYQVSITALPCHLKHDEFVRLVAMTDYYILQIHGLEIPKNIKDNCGIMRRTVVFSAIAKARKLKLPFRVALPTYAYQLHFDKKSGDFAFLSAEVKPVESLQYESRTTDVDFGLLHDIFAMNPDLSYIWFRLPVKGDSLNLDMKSLRLLESGKVPVAKVSVRAIRSGNVVDLYLKNQALVSLGMVVVKLQWCQSTGEFDLFNQTANISKNKVYAVLPTSLQAKAPSCGEEVKIASFYVDELPECKVK